MPINNGWNNKIEDSLGDIVFRAGNNSTEIGTDNANGGIFIGTMTDVSRSILIGNTSAATGLQLQAGTGGMFIEAVDSLSIVSGPTGITIATDAANGPISIVSGTGQIDIAVSATNSTVNVGTGAGVKTVTLGSTNTTSPTVIKSGTGNIVCNSGLTVDSTGRMTNATQPSFLAYLSSTQSNVTGALAVYTIVYNTEVYDVGNNYNNGTGTFTSPLTGKMMFLAKVTVIGCTIANSISLLIVTSNNTFSFYETRAASNANYEKSGNCSCDMDAGDTCTSSIRTGGEASNTDDVYGLGDTTGTIFNGYFLG
jgi:hypothetical protein